MIVLDTKTYFYGNPSHVLRDYLRISPDGSNRMNRNSQINVNGYTFTLAQFIFPKLKSRYIGYEIQLTPEQIQALLPFCRCIRCIAHKYNVYKHAVGEVTAGCLHAKQPYTNISYINKAISLYNMRNVR